MNKELTPLEALDKIKDNMAYQIQLREDCVVVPYFDIVENELIDSIQLKEGIAFRKAEYKKELDSGVDCDGISLSETNRLIIMNLYNIMCALEDYYK